MSIVLGIGSVAAVVAVFWFIVWQGALSDKEYKAARRVREQCDEWDQAVFADAQREYERDREAARTASEPIKQTRELIFDGK
jgi:hypothetical protein